MLFNSPEFLLFLPVDFGLYWFVTQRNPKAQNLMLQKLVTVMERPGWETVSQLFIIPLLYRIIICFIANSAHE